MVSIYGAEKKKYNDKMTVAFCGTHLNGKWNEKKNDTKMTNKKVQRNATRTRIFYCWKRQGRIFFSLLLLKLIGLGLGLGLDARYTADSRNQRRRISSKVVSCNINKT